MRTYGRVGRNPRLPIDATANPPVWVVVTTDAAGNNDQVYVTALIQCIKLNLGESPFFANYGIPAHPSIVQQVMPDFYVQRLQQQFAQYFASLIITRTSNNPPTYSVKIITNSGVKIVTSIAT